MRKVVWSKKFVTIFFVAIAAAIILSYFYARFLGCGACLSDIDIRFIETLKSEVNGKGDIIQLSEIHPGDWYAACASSGGYNADITKTGIPLDDVSLKNSGDTYITEKYDESYLAFYYKNPENGEDSLEIFKSIPSMATFIGASSDNGCVHSKKAALILQTNTVERADFLLIEAK